MITKEEIRKIASLSKLYIEEEQLENLTADMAEIIAFADTINSAFEEVGILMASPGLKTSSGKTRSSPPSPRKRSSPMWTEAKTGTFRSKKGCRREQNG